MKQSLISILGTDLEFDIYDVDDRDRLDTVVPAMVNALSAENLDTSSAAGMRVACHAVFDFFNGLFGEGTDRKIFGGKTNLMYCLEAIHDFFNAIGDSSDDRVKGLMSGRIGKMLAERAARP